MMKAKNIRVLHMAIETGLILGYNRAHKHNDDPGENEIQRQQFDAIMTEIYEWFEMEDSEE